MQLQMKALCRKGSLTRYTSSTDMYVQYSFLSVSVVCVCVLLLFVSVVCVCSFLFVSVVSFVLKLHRL